MLSAYFALLSLASTVRLASILRDRHLALVAGFVLGGNWLFLFYARELRMYTLMPLFVSWIVWSYWRLLEATGHEWWRAWLSLVISCALILYLHYFGIFVLAAVGAYHFLFVRKNRRWVQITLALFTGGMLFLPWVPTVFEGFAGFSNKSFVGMNGLESTRQFWPRLRQRSLDITAGIFDRYHLASQGIGRASTIHFDSHFSGACHSIAYERD